MISLLVSSQVLCLFTMPKLSSWCTASKPSFSSQLSRHSWWGKVPSKHLLFKRSLRSTTFLFFLTDYVLPPAGVEWTLLSSNGPAGSQRGAEWPEEEQRHQQLQRQPHLDPFIHPLTHPASWTPPTATRPQSVPRPISSALTAAGIISQKSCITRVWCLFHMQCLCCMETHISFGNRRVLTLAVVIAWDTVGVVSLGFLSPHIHLALKLLEQWFSAGRCPSFCQPNCHAASCRFRVVLCPVCSLSPPVPSCSFPKRWNRIH